jgi:hypothetical protein
MLLGTTHKVYTSAGEIQEVTFEQFLLGDIDKQKINNVVEEYQIYEGGIPLEYTGE